MIWNLIKKEFLLFIRNPHQLIILLGMPTVLIAILGFALADVLDGNKEAIRAKAVLIQYGNEQEDLEKILSDIEKMNLPEEPKRALKESASQMLPVKNLVEDVFSNQEVKKFVDFQTAKPSELEKIKKDQEVSAIILIPEHFSYQFLRKVLFQEDRNAKISLLTNEGKEMSSEVVEDILQKFQEQYALFTVLSREGISLKNEELTSSLKGKAENVRAMNTIDSITYYTVGMSVMFVLYIATTIAAFSFRERETNVFGRMVVANVSGFTYVLGIFCSGVILAYLQLLIVFGVSAVLFHVKFPNLLPFLLATLFLTFAVGGLTALLSAFNHRFNSTTVSSLFMSVFISGLAFLGGSFTPVGNLSDWIQAIGEWTPNGAGLHSYLKLLQGYPISDSISDLRILLLEGIGMFAFAAFIFPKRST